MDEGFCVQFFAHPERATGLDGASNTQCELYERIVGGNSADLKGFAAKDLELFSASQLRQLGRQMGIRSVDLEDDAAKEDSLRVIFVHMYDVSHGGPGLVEEG